MKVLSIGLSAMAMAIAASAALTIANCTGKTIGGWREAMTPARSSGPTHRQTSKPFDRRHISR